MERGKYKRKPITDEQRKKLSILAKLRGYGLWMKGRKQSEETKLKNSISNKGKVISKEQRIRIGIANKGRIVSDETKKKISIANKGHKHTEESKKKIGDSLRGEKSYLWKGGISKDKRSGNRYIKWRSNVFTRDNWTCQTCGIKSGCGHSVSLEAHHIKSWAKYPEFRYILSNGITLCKDCHKLTDNYKGHNK